jgi:hypothetical protein
MDRIVDYFFLIITNFFSCLAYVCILGRSRANCFVYILGLGIIDCWIYLLFGPMLDFRFRV